MKEKPLLHAIYKPVTGIFFHDLIESTNKEFLVKLVRFREALPFDVKALAEVQSCANAGDTLSQEEMWIYIVNRGCLYLRLGRIDEAEQLLDQALPRIHPRRRNYRMFARKGLDEIEQWRKTKSAHYQLDWRWVNRYRELDAYDAYWWWAQAGPFNEEEQQEWNRLFTPNINETTKELLGKLIAQSRQRELMTAFAEQREPRLYYPALDIDEVRRRSTALLQLDTEIRQEEPHPIVRRLYHGTIEDEVGFLQMIEATYEGNSERFLELNRCLFPDPTHEEMAYALSRLRRLIQQGFEHPETTSDSQYLLRLLHERLHLTINLSEGKEEPPVVLADVPGSSTSMISAQAAKRFFETILQEAGYEGWQVAIDPKATGPRVESALRMLFLQDGKISVERIRHYVSHEFAGHIARSVAGERSLLGLLSINTKGYSSTEEGIALYHERQTATLHGQAFDDLALWLGTFAVGLARGVITPPQTFLSLYSFFEPLLLLYDMLLKPSRDREKARVRAQKDAITRCIRVFRGAPDLERAGICLSSDIVYLRGLWKIEHAVAEDASVLNRLAVGKIALELLPELQELEMIIPPQPFRELAHDPGLDSYILSFEQSNYYLDHQWFSRYHELASYSDVSWLTQAGPFLEEEQQEWDMLIQQKEHASASKRLSSIIVTSRKRELEASLREQREPRFHYPRVPFDEVQARIAGFSRLRAEIERDERNAIVRRLYFGAIDELLDELHMIVSASRRNDEAFWTFNQRLNPTPTVIEMEMAIGQLTSLLRNGVLRDDTRGLAKQLIQHIRQWHIDPMSSHYGSEDAEQDALAEQKKQLVTLHGSPKLFSPETVSQFFVDIFRQYQFPWTVTHDLATDHAYISQPLKQLVLPADKWISGEKIRDLLGHEIETHVFRAVAGEKSSLALLSIGLGGYLETEEGLAIYYTQEASGYNATEKPDKPWLGTLATGLAVGVICEPYTFRKLQMFLESVNTLRSLLAEENLSVAEIQENARRNAQNRCLRTWRGVTDLTRPGICSTKDNVYLRGYLAVSQALAKDTMAFERLMVGAIGLQHLDDLTELGITAPPVKHLRLATDPELDTYIARFAD